MTMLNEWLMPHRHDGEDYYFCARVIKVKLLSWNFPKK